MFSVSMDREREFYAQKREGGEKPRLPSGRVYVEKIRKIAEKNYCALVWTSLTTVAPEVSVPSMVPV